MKLSKASHQWATRPADQRFWNVTELHAAVVAHRAAARTSNVVLNKLRVEANEGRVQLVGETGRTAEVTHHAFGQLAARANAPAGYLRQLPATLAVQNINHGLKARAVDDPDAKASLLLHENGGFYARAITSDKYTRIWNQDITQRLLWLESEGWRTPPARPAGVSDEKVRRATAADAAVSLTVREGDEIAPAGLYASFEDMFAFMLHPERVIRDGSPEGLMRGFMTWNSEVGKSTWGFCSFYFRGACGNHIIWDASDVKEIKLRHVGNVDVRAFEGLEVELKKYADASASDIEAKIAVARRFVLKGTNAEDVVDLVFKSRLMTRQDATAAYAAVIPEVDGDPYTAWGFAQGITRFSQTKAHADDRVALDRAAGKVIEMAF